jgi:hypothetical protein
MDIIPAQAVIYNYLKGQDSRLRGNDMSGSIVESRI